MNELEAIAKFVLGLALVLKADPQEIMKAAQQNPKALESAVITYQKTLDINQAAAEFTKALQLPKVARHGAKLNYLKTLKNQCAEDEEVVYYKKGGSVGCGCKKKEDGGEINKAQKGTAVSNFKKNKNKKKEINPNDTVQYRGKAYDITAKESPEKSNPKNIGPTGYQRLSKELWRKMEKTKEGMAARERVELKDEVEEANRKKSGGVVSKFKAAKCGAKMKKHQNGGSLNGVPFYQTGTPKGGIVLNNDATYVAPVKAFNPETMYFEPTQESWEDLIPIYGSYREAKKMDENPTWQQGVALGTSVLSDALSFGLIGTAAKTALRGSKYAKLLKARGFKPITTDGRILIKGGYRGNIGADFTPYFAVRQIPKTNQITTYIKGLRPNGIDVTTGTGAAAAGIGLGKEFPIKK